MNVSMSPNECSGLQRSIDQEVVDMLMAAFVGHPEFQISPARSLSPGSVFGLGNGAVRIEVQSANIPFARVGSEVRALQTDKAAKIACVAQRRRCITDPHWSVDPAAGDDGTLVFSLRSLDDDSVLETGPIIVEGIRNYLLTAAEFNGHRKEKTATRLWT